MLLEGGATKQAGKFIKRVEEALELGAMEERYEAGQRDIKLLTDYVYALQRPAPGKARAVISDYMETLSAEEMADPDILCLIGQAWRYGLPRICPPDGQPRGHSGHRRPH